MLKRRSNIPGFQEGGANVDPVSGNDVPTGSLPEEVRDDIDAKLSPGEFVFPADVVRFIGLERLMKIRDEAKKGLQRMSEIGQMGNAEEVGEASNGTYEDEGFESEIDDILEEIEAEENDRDVNEQTEVMMAEGGFVKSGTDLTKAPKNPVFDVRYYKNAEGSVMYITHINGKPMTPIPEGYKAVTQEEAQKVGQKAEEAAKATQAQQQESSYDPSEANRALGIDPTGDFLDAEAKTPGARDARMERVSKNIERITGNLPFGGAAKKVSEFIFGKPRQDLPAPVEIRTPTPVGDIGRPFLTETSKISMAEAVTGDAYSQAKDSGLSDEAASRAAAAAAEALNRGQDPAVAINIGVVAGVSYQNDLDSLMEANPSRPSTTSSPVTSSGGGASRPLTPAEMGESSVGTPSSEPDYTSPRDSRDSPFADTLAKGGLVNKRQYPAKKKRGKGLASAKT